MITMFGLSLWLKLNNNFYQIQPGKRSYMAPTFVYESDVKSVFYIYQVESALYFKLTIRKINQCVIVNYCSRNWIASVTKSLCHNRPE